MPAAAADTTWKDFAAAVECPVYAIVLGLLGNALLTAAEVRDRIAGGFRTEFFIKTGLVLLGASINLSVIVAAAGSALAQAVLLITIVFAFTWWLAGKLGLDDKLRADLLPVPGGAGGDRRLPAHPAAGCPDPGIDHLRHRPQ